MRDDRRNSPRLPRDFGWQEDIGDSRVYVMHFPTRGPASIRIEELQEMKAASEGR
jgi:hypothetical protein